MAKTDDQVLKTAELLKGSCDFCGHDLPDQVCQMQTVSGGISICFSICRQHLSLPVRGSAALCQQHAAHLINEIGIRYGLHNRSLWRPAVRTPLQTPLQSPPETAREIELDVQPARRPGLIHGFATWLAASLHRLTHQVLSRKERR